MRVTCKREDACNVKVHLFIRKMLAKNIIFELGLLCYLIILNRLSFSLFNGGLFSLKVNYSKYVKVNMIKLERFSVGVVDN